MFRGNEEKVIYAIVDDILQLEDKIEDINSKKQNDPNEKQKEQLDALKHDFNQNSLDINNIQSHLTEAIDENNENINKKQADIAKLQRTITEIERQLRNLAVTSVTSSASNSLRMSYEKIEDMINSKKTNDDLKLLEQEYSNHESTHLSIEESIKATQHRKNELNENLQMMKEEKTMIHADLINIISQKESLEEMAKLKLHTMKTGEKVSNIALLHTRYSIKSMELYKYEILSIDLNKISKEISEALIDLNEDILSRTYLLNMIKNESIDYLRNKIWQKKPNEFLEVLTTKGINILQAVSTIKELSEEHLNTYFKAIFKVSYYETIIFAKIAFVSKEYKAIKKDIKEEIKRLQAEMNKLHAKKEEIEGKIKEIHYKMNVLVDNKAKDGISLTREERNFLQLNDKINELNALKDEIVYEIDQLVHQNDELQLEANEKLRKLNKMNDAMNNKITLIGQEIKDNYLKSNDEIVCLRQLIADKFRIIKTQLKIYKEQYGNNLDLYNRLVENINSTLRMSSILKPSYSSILLNHEELECENTNRQLMSSFRQKHIPKTSQTQRSEKNKSVIYHHQQLSKTPQKSYREHQSNYNNKPLRTPDRIDQYSELVNYDNNNLDYIMPRCLNEDLIKTPNKKTHNSNSSITPTRNKNKSSSSNKNLFNQNNNFNHIIQCNNSNTNNNDNLILWNENKVKLEKTIHKLKSSISKNESIIDKEVIMEKLKPIFRSAFCYYRLIGNNTNWESKFNPLENSIHEKIFGFAKANISLNSKLSSLTVRQSNGIVKEISIDEIESTIVTNVMKYIIKIFRNYKRARLKQIEIKDFIDQDEFSDIPLKADEKIKAALNQLFNMTIKLNHDQRIEFVFLSYEDFKIWLNGLAFLIKNKTDVYKYRTMMIIMNKEIKINKDKDKERFYMI